MSLICKYCDKEYKSYSSRSNHIRKFHINPKVIQSHPQMDYRETKSHPKSSSIEGNSSLYCQYCNKVFKYKQGKWKHEQKCKNNQTSEDSKDVIIKELKEIIKKQDDMIKTKFSEMKNELLETLNKNAKIHPKTLEKINKQLNSNNNSHNNNSNNKMVINNTYVKFGSLSYDKILTDKQQRDILRQQRQSLTESIKRIHFNKDLPEYNNVFITNMKDDIAYVFDGKQFISVRKNEMLNELVNMHIDEINISFEKNKGKLDKHQIQRLEKFLDMLNDDNTKYTDDTQRIFTNYKAYKINEVKLMVYNESDSKKLSTLTNMDLEEKIYEESDSSSLSNLSDLSDSSDSDIEV